LNIAKTAKTSYNKKVQLSLTNPRDDSASVARFIYMEEQRGFYI